MMKDAYMMRIEFWIDFLSPECFKQHQALEVLLKKYQFNDLEILYRSYEIMPQMTKKDSSSLLHIMASHHLVTLDEAEDMIGETYKLMNPVQMHDAHRLAHLAKKSNLAFEFHKSIFEAYFVKKEDISNPKVLYKIACKIGMKSDQVEHVLTSDTFSDSVRMNRENAIVKGIFEVPHIRIDGKIKLTSYHTDAQIIEAISMASIHFHKTEYCEGEHCERKKAR